jgi:hypothetical protein
MALQTTNLTADGTTLIATLDQKHRWPTNEIGVHAHGTYGSGTLTFQYSLDAGTTKVTIKDGAGTGASDIEYTASGGFTWKSPVTTGGPSILLYAVLSGSSSADIDVYVTDPNIG